MRTGPQDETPESPRAGGPARKEGIRTMRRIAWIAALSCLVAGVALAEGQGTKTPAKAAAAGAAAKEAGPMTAVGEIVDMGCYLGHGAKGAEHKGCATKCIAGGMPMGLLAKDGTLYLLTMSHENADPFNAAKQMAAEMVRVTGPMHERDGVKSLEVTAIEPAKAAAAKG